MNMSGRTLPQIASLVPHGPPMSLLDELLDHGADFAITRMRVTHDKPFVDAAGHFPAWAGIELMAQTIAAFGGLRSLAAGQPAKIGFLLGSRRYRSEVGQFPLGSVLTVTARQLVLDQQGLGVFDCRIDSAAGVATAHVSAFQPDDPSRLLSPWAS